MARLSFAGFKDPVRRPRYVVWCVVGVLALAAVVVVALGVTSTRWFCAEGCHKVQDDTIVAYEHSAHSEISCMACHMPVNANPVIFVLHKAEALGELYMTVTGKFELPLNGESEVGLTMKSTQCTQCHDLQKRKVTPSVGVLINHKAHAEKDVTCTICHNRTAHVEDFELTLKDPNTGEVNRKHEDFMTMKACFRCHSQRETPEGGLKAPGKCSACHPVGFQLKPASHFEAGFFPKNHARLAQEEASRVAEFSGEGGGEEATEGGTEKAVEGHSGTKGVGPGLVKTESLNLCYTCHSETFCTDCHKVPMPHPAGFKKEHGKLGKKSPKVCGNCHGDPKVFCDECHHGSSLEWQYDTATVWRRQHPRAVTSLGASACFKCHEPTYCAACHVRGN